MLVSNGRLIGGRDTNTSESLRKTPSQVEEKFKFGIIENWMKWENLVCQEEKKLDSKISLFIKII